MKPTSHIHMTKSAFWRFSVSLPTAVLLAAVGLAAAQDQAPRPWRSVNDPLPASLDQAPDQPASGNTRVDSTQGDPVQAGSRQNQAPPPLYNAPAAADTQNYPPPPNGNYGVPPRLTIKNGTYVTVRMNQWLSSDRNRRGDTFTATLDQPLVVNGIVVAQRGQNVYGRVTEAQKAGRVEGTSRLAVQLTQLTLVDGNQASVESQMINRKGPTSVGRDAAAIGGTTALGAIVGAGVNGGVGAGVGAGAGAVVGILGVLLTRGRPTVIYPESVLTFQIQAPVEIATDHAPQAFQYVNSQQDYGRNPAIASRPPSCYNCGGAVPPPASVYGPGYYPGYYPPYAYAYPYPYYYGGFGVVVGRGFYGRGYYGGFRGGFRR